MTYRVIYTPRGHWAPSWRDFTTRDDAEKYADSAAHEDAGVVEIEESG